MLQSILPVLIRPDYLEELTRGIPDGEIRRCIHLLGQIGTLVCVVCPSVVVRRVASTLASTLRVRYFRPKRNAERVQPLRASGQPGFSSQVAYEINNRVVSQTQRRETFHASQAFYVQSHLVWQPTRPQTRQRQQLDQRSQKVEAHLAKVPGRRVR